MAIISVILTSRTATSYVIPANFNSLLAIEAIGPGGARNNTAPNCTSGGGGAYAKIITLSGLTAGQTCYYQAGQEGATGSATPTDAWFNTSNTAPSSTATGVLAKCGNNSSTAGVGGLGGTAAASIGATTYSGGNGGSNNSGTTTTMSGGGGAAGPNGAGKNGGSVVGVGIINAYAGGGGCDAGLSTAGGNVTASGTNGIAGTGPTGSTTNQGAGGSGTNAGTTEYIWNPTISAYGPGGGGGGGFSAGIGYGGAYGGGGAYSGGQGIIVFTYSTVNIPAYTTKFLLMFPRG